MLHQILYFILFCFGISNAYSDLTVDGRVNTYPTTYGYLEIIQGGSANFTVCQDYCYATYQTQIGSIWSVRENADLKNFFNVHNEGGSGSTLGIGFVYDTQTTSFQWRDGVPNDYTNWDTNEPDTDQECSIMSLSGKWQSEDCSTEITHFFCNKYERFFSENFVLSRDHIGGNDFLNYTTSSQYCSTWFGQNLATIRSQEDTDELNATFAYFYFLQEESSILISLNNFSGVEYVWATQKTPEDYGYVNWFPGQPSYADGICAGFDFQSNEWFSLGCANDYLWVLCDLWGNSTLLNPTTSPTLSPVPPSKMPTKSPTDQPTGVPSKAPTNVPISTPTTPPTMTAPPVPTTPPTMTVPPIPTKQPTQPPIIPMEDLNTTTSGPTETENPNQTDEDANTFQWYYILIIILGVLLCLLLIILLAYKRKKNEEKEKYDNQKSTIQASTNLKPKTYEPEKTTVEMPTSY